jgi:acetylglutamate kinase
MRLCVKIGGAQLEQEAARSRLATAVANARAAGHELVLVHGGGNQIRALSARLGIPDRYHEGLRITDEPTAEVVLMVLGGAVNKTLVRSLGEAGVPAVGICGADGGTFSVRRHAPGGQDLGFVGAVRRVDRRLVDSLLAAAFVPVLATIAPLDTAEPGDRSALYNVNADHAAAPLARAFGCGAMLFLTDVPGVLDANGQLLPSLGVKSCEELRRAGVIRGGMIPKIDAALGALRDLPSGLVKIAPADSEDAVLRALDDTVGTRFVAANTGGL